jgi:hypothetical protein
MYQDFTAPIHIGQMLEKWLSPFVQLSRFEVAENDVVPSPGSFVAIQTAKPTLPHVAISAIVVAAKRPHGLELFSYITSTSIESPGSQHGRQTHSSRNHREQEATQVGSRKKTLLTRGLR